ncbi:MAG: PDZ domain-containing protein [Prevotellaceae bacterium]|jgi:C-terminal processing protease CtpA/Prc|nr:PDZ domain-containing protein [Prevotellaceae bacterium]
MKKIFTIMMLCAVMSGYAQSSQTYGFEWKNNIASYGKGHFVVTQIMPYFPAWHSGLRQHDVILRINDSETSTMNALPSVIRTMEIRRPGQREPVKITMLPPVAYPENSLSERELVTNLSRSIHEDNDFLDEYAKTIVYTDPEADFMDFRTFDFEYSNEENPAFEKEIAGSVQRNLETLGLKRDKENPDMLIFINFFDGIKENYVPPKTDLTTRYRTIYNVWTRRYESRQYIESNTSGGYTNTKYLYLVQLSFLDANAAQTQSKVAPVIWRADFGKEYGKEQNNLDFANKACRELIDYGYPYKKSGRFYYTNYNYEYDRGSVANNKDTYWFTGLLFNSNNLQKITFVAAGSPADRAGIKAGDIVTKTGGTAAPKKLNDLYYYSKSKSSFRYLNIDYNRNYRKGDNNEVTFEIKRGKQKMKITVLAERARYWK